MPSHSLTLDSLPVEILTRIFKPLLQHTAQQAHDFNVYSDFDDSRTYAHIAGPVPPDGQTLQPQLLRVCKAFNEIGTKLLYANDLIFMVNTITYYVSEDGTKHHRAWAKQLAHPRDDRHRIKRLYLIIYTPDFYFTHARNSDGDWLDELFEGLAAHQPCWDEISVVLHDLTAAAVYNLKIQNTYRLCYGLGRLHAKDVPHMRDEALKWCIQQPEHKYPLPLLHQYLSEYFDEYTTPEEGEEEVSERRDELLQRSLASSKSRDEAVFFSTMEEAVEHVTEVFRKRMERPKYRDDVELAETVPKWLERCETQGKQLLTARNGNWKAAYRPNRRG